MGRIRIVKMDCKIYQIFQLHKTKLALVIVLTVFLLLIFESYLQNDIRYQEVHFIQGGYYQNWTFSKHDKNITRKYLIDTPHCSIPEIDPFNPETLNLSHPERYTSCSEKRFPLTYIKKDKDIITLNVNKSLTSSYSMFRISCCYAVVRRQWSVSAPDDTIKVSGCTSFKNSVVVNDPIIYVSCENIFFVEVYANVHAIVSPKYVEEKKKITSPTAFSVLLVGIDSMSKTNLQRTMPKTYSFLEDHYINLKGFVKIALNTLPNLMGILAGLNLEQIKQCRYIQYVDQCYNIWKIFREKGYITAYGEDAVNIATFNCCGKKGFTVPPTDFYFRPYMIAAERLGVVERENMNYCAGPETEGERIMNLAKDFQVTFENQSTFGLFWMNSFSHDDVNMPGAMDAKIEEFLKEITKHLHNTIFLFFSDHGIRFGDIRTTYSGWFEERIPFFYIYLPQKFKSLYPEKYGNVRINSKRLTNPYDIYMTLQDLLFLADKSHVINQSLACPLCRSIFTEISRERSCDDAAIPEEWCVCNVSSYIGAEEPFYSNVAHVFLNEINKLVFSDPQGYKCQLFRLHRIKFVGISQFGTVLVRVQTKPKAIFEGSYVLSSNDLEPKLRLVGKIDRLDRYASNSWCIKDSSFEMYCYCVEKKLLKFLFQLNPFQ